MMVGASRGVDQDRRRLALVDVQLHRHPFRVEMVADIGRLGGLEIVELNPALDVPSETSRPRVESLVRQEHAASLRR